VHKPFGPDRVVTDPAGRRWELYMSKVVPPEWSGGYDSMEDPFPLPGFAGLAQIPFVLVATLWSAVISPLLRFLFLYPVALTKGIRSRSARIEAICFSSEFGIETRTWTTTADQAKSVLATIATGLEEGQVAQPAGAVYSGSRVEGPGNYWT
jgi:hypothetical protein